MSATSGSVARAGRSTLTDLSAAEADALDGMLWPADSRRRTRLYAGGSVKVELARLDERLRESGLGISLRAALEHGCRTAPRPAGPARQRAADRERVWTEAFASPALRRPTAAMTRAPGLSG